MTRSASNTHFCSCGSKKNAHAPRLAEAPQPARWRLRLWQKAGDEGGALLLDSTPLSACGALFDEEPLHVAVQQGHFEEAVRPILGALGRPTERTASATVPELHCIDAGGLQLLLYHLNSAGRWAFRVTTDGVS